MQLDLVIPNWRTASVPARPQRGVVLLIALIILVALTLAGVALVRSVNTTNLIAGNMSFRQVAVHAGERGTEAAITQLRGSSVAVLNGDDAMVGYSARRVDPDPLINPTWPAFWTNSLQATAQSIAVDAGGNTVSYFIHRLCDGAGSPSVVNCSKSPTALGSGNTNISGAPVLEKPTQVYYRITTRIDGPRNAVAYVQTVIAL